ncbi:MAG: RES domain-containing protein [Nitrospira sp.]|nr:RES domain-containing protein [Nitrospira sp.]
MEIEGVQEIIERLRGGATRRLSYDQIRRLISVLARHGMYQTYKIQSDLSIQRARWIKDKKWFASEEDLGPPPPEATIDYGRCHQPKRPLCYCSLEGDTALAEITAELGEHYVIATYTMPKGTVIVPVGELDCVKRTGQTYIGHGNSDAAKPYLDALDKENGIVLALIDAFLADEFSKPATNWTDYKITSAFSDVLLNGDLKPRLPIDVIIYPSVRFREGKNFAILPEVHKSKMQLVVTETKIIEITDVLGYGIFGHRTLATLRATGADRRLSWEKMQD